MNLTKLRVCNAQPKKNCAWFAFWKLSVQHFSLKKFVHGLHFVILDEAKFTHVKL